MNRKPFEAVESDPLLDTNQVARILGYRPRTLEGMRSRGDGPPFIRLSPRAVRYRLSDLESWLDSRRRTSTSGGDLVGE